MPYNEISSCMKDGELTVCTTPKVSLSQVKVVEFKVAVGDQTIIVSEKIGGLYLPIPVVFAEGTLLPDGDYEIVGRWNKKKDGTYVLYVSGTRQSGIDSTLSPGQ